MNAADLVAMVDQMRRNLTPTRQIIFTITSTGVVTIHKTFGWVIPFEPTDIVLAGGTVIVTSRNNEFFADGLFVTVNTNSNYSWTNALVCSTFAQNRSVSIKWVLNVALGSYLHHKSSVQVKTAWSDEISLMYKPSVYDKTALNKYFISSSISFTNSVTCSTT